MGVGHLYIIAMVLISLLMGFVTFVWGDLSLFSTNLEIWDQAGFVPIMLVLAFYLFQSRSQLLGYFFIGFGLLGAAYFHSISFWIGENQEWSIMFGNASMAFGIYFRFVYQRRVLLMGRFGELKYTYLVASFLVVMFLCTLLLLLVRLPPVGGTFGKHPLMLVPGFVYLICVKSHLYRVEVERFSPSLISLFFFFLAFMVFEPVATGGNLALGLALLCKIIGFVLLFLSLSLMYEEQQEQKSLDALKDNFPQEVLIRTRILLLISILVLMSMLLIGALAYHPFRSAIISSETDWVNKDLEVIGTQLISGIEESCSNLQYLGETPPIQGMIRSLRNEGLDPLDRSTIEQWRQRLAQLFATMMRLHPRYLEISYIGLDDGRELVKMVRESREVVSLDADRLDTRLQDPFFQEVSKLRQGQFYISDVHLLREDGQVLSPRVAQQTIGLPVFDDQEQLFGIIVLNRSFEPELTKIASLNDAFSKVYLVNDQAQFLAHPDEGVAFAHEDGDGELLSDHFFDLDLSPIGNDSQIKFHEHGDDHQLILGFYKVRFDPRKPERFLGILRTSDLEQSIEASTETMRQFIIAGILVTIIALICGWLFSRMLLDPLEQLSVLMTEYEIHDQKHSLDLGTRSKDEFGSLINSFGRMTAQIEEHTHRLESEISKRRHAERVQSQTAMHFSALVDHMIDGVISIDAKGTIEFFNNAASEILGYEAKEVIGRNVNVLMGEPYHSKHDSFMSSYLNTGHAKVIGIGREVEARHKAGYEIPIHLSVSKMAMADGIHFIGIIRDITKSKALERERDRATALMVQTGEIAQIAGWEMNLNSNQITWSQHILDIIGQEPEAHGSFSFIDVEHQNRVNYALNQLIKRGVSFTLEVSFSREGRNIPARLVGRADLVNHQPDRVYGFIQDISREKEVAQMKSDFVSTVSHELRTPLTSILGSLSLILGGVVGSIPESALKLIGMAKSNSERLLNLINDILDIEKLESGKMVMKIQPHLIVPTIQQCITDNKGFAVKHRITFEMYFDERELDNVAALLDINRFSQVMNNLLSNAAKFSPEDSKVIINLYIKNERVHIEVVDRGPGISKDFQNSMFDKFTQEDNVNTRTHGGTGLGLSITKALLLQMSSDLMFTSEEGVGTTFYFSLPIDLGEEALDHFSVL